jgi:hypothetical protein
MVDMTSSLSIGLRPQRLLDHQQVDQAAKKGHRAPFCLYFSRA